MRTLILISGAALALSACGEAPADESPVAPEVVCGQPEQDDNDSALECPTPDNELVDENIGDPDGKE